MTDPAQAGPAQAGPAQAAPRLSVIIPHYNDLTRLNTCLTALLPQTTALAEPVEIIVVDNDSPVDLDPLRTAHPDLTVVIEPRKGAAAARNRGVRDTRAPHIAFLDSDCVPASDWLATALRLAGGDDISGGRVDTFDETPPPRTGAQAFETVFAFQQRTYIEKMGFSVTANLVTSRAIFEDVGDMVLGLSEDEDWCLRARAKGYRLVYAPDLRVGHPTRSDWPALLRKWQRLGHEQYVLNGTDPRARLAWGLRSVAVLGSTLPHLLRLARTPLLRDRTERLRGAAVLVRLRLLRFGWMLRQATTGR